MGREAVVDKSGRIDVPVSNAANFHAGFFEELWPEQMEGPLWLHRRVAVGRWAVQQVKRGGRDWDGVQLFVQGH